MRITNRENLRSMFTFFLKTFKEELTWAMEDSGTYGTIKNCSQHPDLNCLTTLSLSCCTKTARNRSRIYIYECA